MKEHLDHTIQADAIEELNHLGIWDVMNMTLFEQGKITLEELTYDGTEMRAGRDEIIFGISCKIIGQRLDPFLNVAAKAVLMWVSDGTYTDSFVKEFFDTTGLLDQISKRN